MSQRHPMALIAGAATMLAAAPLATVFESFTWLFFTAVGVAVIAGTAMLVRTLRGPVWAQVLAMMGALLLYLTFAFPSGGEILRLIPTAETFKHFNSLLVTAGEQIRDEAIPIPDYDGILLLTTAGVGLVAVLVDLAAVGLRRPALAGLPMLAIYSVPVAVLPGGLSVLPFGLAAIGFLWLLVADSVDRVRRFGRRFTGEGRDVDLWEPSPLSSAGRRLGAVGLAVAIILPIAVPGMTSGLIDRFGTGGLGPGSGPGASGGAATVNLSALLRDNLIRDDEFEMVRVRTTDPTPYYLRFGIADQATTEGFTSRAPASGTTISRGLPEWLDPSIAGVTSQRYTATVDVVNLDMGLLPFYSQPVLVDNLDNSWFFDPSSNQIFSRRSTVQGLTYNFEFVRASYTAQALRSAGSIPPTDAGLRELVSLPVVPQVSTIVAEITRGRSLQYDKVKAIYDYFDTEDFVYSLSTAPGGTGNAIVDFLASKRGFCVQYAAAMAWMVRAAGFPARVAFGFTRGGGSNAGVYSLTNFNLHAWTEVYFQNIGWVPFDATPSGAVEGAVASAYTDPANPTGPGEEENPSPTPGVSGGPALDPTDRGLGEGEEGGPGAQVAPINVWYASAGAAALLVMLLLIAPALRRRALRRRRRARSGDVIVLGDGSQALPETYLVRDPAAAVIAQRDAHEAWAELLDTMVDYSVPVDPSETPRATAQRLGGLIGLDPAAKPPVGLLASAEERARYAKLPLQTRRLDDATRVMREALAQRVSRWERLRAWILPRSVIQRWRATWVGWTSAAVGVTGRVRSAMLTLSPRRLLAR